MNEEILDKVARIIGRLVIQQEVHTSEIQRLMAELAALKAQLAAAEARSNVVL